MTQGNRVARSLLVLSLCLYTWAAASDPSLFLWRGIHKITYWDDLICLQYIYITDMLNLAIFVVVGDWVESFHWGGCKNLYRCCTHLDPMNPFSFSAETEAVQCNKPLDHAPLGFQQTARITESLVVEEVLRYFTHVGSSASQGGGVKARCTVSAVRGRGQSHADIKSKKGRQRDHMRQELKGWKSCIKWGNCSFLPEGRRGVAHWKIKERDNNYVCFHDYDALND